MPGTVAWTTLEESRPAEMDFATDVEFPRRVSLCMPEVYRALSLALIITIRIHTTLFYVHC